MNHTSFVGFAWCTNANQGTYRAILEYLKERAPDLKNKLKTIYTDFEQAAILAYGYELPNAKIHGCYFHYTQNITKHFDDVEPSEPKKLNNDGKEKLKKRKPPKEILFVAHNLPLLPANKLEEGLQVLAKVINRYIKEWPDLKKFKDYMIKQWLGKAELLSCFNNHIRTNNISEAFNRTLLNRIGGKHPTLGTFLYNMYNIIFVEKINIDREIKSHRETKIQQNYNKNMTIKNIETALNNGLISVEYFLYQTMSEENKEKISRDRSYRQDELKYDEFKINEQVNEQLVLVPEEYKPDYGTKKRCNNKKSSKLIKKSDVIINKKIIENDVVLSSTSGLSLAENINISQVTKKYGELSSKKVYKKAATKTIDKQRLSTVLGDSLSAVSSMTEIGNPKVPVNFKRSNESTPEINADQFNFKRQCVEQKEELSEDDIEVKNYLIKRNWIL